METSLRCSGNDRALRIHAKQKLALDPKTSLQVHGELNTNLGAPTHVSAIIRQFYPELSASLGMGMLYDKRHKLRYSVSGKKAFPVSSDGLVSFNIKGRCDLDKEFMEALLCLRHREKKETKSDKRTNFVINKKARGGVEFVWSVFNFQKDQDLRLKLGYEVSEKVPYLQIRENNWTLNADLKGRWSIRYDL